MADKRASEESEDDVEDLGRIVDRNTEILNERFTDKTEVNPEENINTQNEIIDELDEIIDKLDEYKDDRQTSFAHRLTCPSCQFNESIDNMDKQITVENKSDIDGIVSSLDRVVSYTEQKNNQVLLAFAELSMEEKSIARTKLDSFESVSEFEFVTDYECLITLSLAEATCGHCGFSWKFNIDQLDENLNLLSERNQNLKNEVNHQQSKLHANQKLINQLLSYSHEKITEIPNERFTDKLDLLHRSATFMSDNDLQMTEAVRNEIESQLETHADRESNGLTEKINFSDGSEIKFNSVQTNDSDEEISDKEERSLTSSPLNFKNIFQR